MARKDKSSLAAAEESVFEAFLRQSGRLLWPLDSLADIKPADDDNERKRDGDEREMIKNADDVAVFSHLCLPASFASAPFARHSFGQISRRNMRSGTERSHLWNGCAAT